MTGQQLKNSILQMAVQGKLVPQDPNDEPASVLLERIRKEKEQLIKEGKIKKEKNPSCIFRGADNLPYEKVGKNEPVCIADEVPYEIPESWEWVRLGEIFHHNTGKALNASNRSGELLTYITTSNLYWNRFEIDSLREMYFSESEIEKCTATKGDLLVCEGGDIGRAAIWPYDTDIRIQNHIHRLRSYSEICTEYYYYIFFLYKHAGWIGGKGIGIQGLSANALHSLLLPLPPLSEQHRIVTKIKEFEPFLDKYAQAEKRLNDLNTQFPNLLKKSILQEAVQGKLVPQDPTDEPASVLLERIRAEKEQLIKAGKIKRDKHESVIFRRDNSHYEKLDGIERCIDDEIPFDLPESWEWVRFFSVVDIATNLVRPEEYADYMHIAPDNIEKATGTLFECHTVQQDKVVSPNHLFYKGQIIYSKIRPLLRKAVIAPFDGLCSADMYPLNSAINRKYLLRYMLSDAFNLQVATAMSSRVKMPKINQDELSKILIPIPPMREQERIVSKIEELFDKITLI